MKDISSSLSCPRPHAGDTTSLTRRLGFVVLFGLGVLASPSAGAQPTSGGPGPGTPPPAASDVPLDGGASLLLAGGLGYALRRLRRARKP
ncbi:hypothetical protein Q5H92_02075 [Hymenobacter sp. M29]|uniref:VPDSG-CTERM protein sorting domain-containing protein n=1 Tax=Hymenobacter mellowenesis TaxID=3063995 RepID=A0ABT9A5K7_9BACT|nr:hypothetical protein [Hymenobacter sp. M29]MDO7845127.1 hypothetical protein [Hymenobacter sp. M29]